MKIINQNLFGCWKLTGMRFLNADGTWESEKVMGGISTFTESGHVNTFSRTSELPFGYTGTFTIQGNDLMMHLDVCSIAELEGQTVKRTVKTLTSESLTLAMDDEATGRHYEIDFKMLDSSFRR